ncbi:MAG: NADAR family protein [Patescibacteria group bacterium]|jgi:hypothetical protein
MTTQLQQYRDSALTTDGSVIGFYEREFYVFSNFSSFQVEWHGRLWPTSEHAYQAAHFFDTAPELVEQIFHAKSAHEAFKIAKTNADKAPANWEDIKVGIMEDICKHKLLQHRYIQRKLLQTGDLPLVEDSPADPCWGWGKDRQGRNELGKVWMRLRDWFIANTDSTTQQNLLKD